MICCDADETRKRLKYVSIAREIELVLELKKAGLAFAPERIVMQWNDADCLLVMPACDDQWLVNKLVTIHRSNPERNLPMIRGEVVLIRRADGTRMLTLDGSTVTAMRTAALSLVAIQRMGYAHAETFTVCGSGVQAKSHIEAIFEWKPTCKIQVFARNQPSAQVLIDAMKDRGCQITATHDLPEAVASSSVVITATSSHEPVICESTLSLRDPSPLLFIAVGAYRSDMAELSVDLVSRIEGLIVVDTVEGASREAGDLLQANIPIERLIGIERVDSSALSGNVHLFKSVGNALWDLAAARVALREPHAVRTH